jgi:glycosyltransferase involved in cell wall biosynthesis
MIVKNEKAHLENCLKSAGGVFDEIIIVDTGSSDTTKTIARKYADKVFDFIWCDNFSRARNFAIEKATSDYFMWLDADDVIPTESAEKILELKRQMKSDVDVVHMPYHTSFDEKGNPNFTFYRERILKNVPQARFEGAVHEAITPFGNNVYLDIPIEHRKIERKNPKRNLQIYENELKMGNELKPRDQFYYGRELFYNEKYTKSIRVLNKFLDSQEGWRENKIDACKFLSYNYYQKKQDEKALLALLRTFEFDSPRAEVMCDIAKHFMDRNEIKSAIFWYSCALEQEPDFTSGSFVTSECYDYVPALQLCLCYYRLGLLDEAKNYNELAKKYKETDATRYNDKYFNVTIKKGDEVIEPS